MTGLEKKLQMESDKGGVNISNSWAKIARWRGAVPRIIKATIDEYNRFCDRGDDRMFAKGRRFLVLLRAPPYYGVTCYQGFLGTLGGMKINHYMEVLDQQDDSISGLYGGGSDAGGEGDT